MCGCIWLYIQWDLWYMVYPVTLLIEIIHKNLELLSDRYIEHPLEAATDTDIDCAVQLWQTCHACSRCFLQNPSSIYLFFSDCCYSPLYEAFQMPAYWNMKKIWTWVMEHEKNMHQIDLFVNLVNRSIWANDQTSKPGCGLQVFLVAENLSFNGVTLIDRRKRARIEIRGGHEMLRRQMSCLAHQATLAAFFVGGR